MVTGKSFTILFSLFLDSCFRLFTRDRYVFGQPDVICVRLMARRTGWSLTTLFVIHSVWRAARHAEAPSQRKVAVRNYIVSLTFTNVIDTLCYLGLPWPFSQGCCSSVLASKREIYQSSLLFMPHTLTYTSIHIYLSSAIAGKHLHIQCAKIYETDWWLMLKWQHWI